MVAVDITSKQNGGVLKEIIKEGIGDKTPEPGSYVTVHYTGTFLDGTKFDSTKDRNEPFEFVLKKGTVIKVWNIGVATMKKGEIAVFTCAPKYAFGKNGNPPKIPPNATLVFEIELIDWRGEDLSLDQDRSIEKYQIIRGRGFLPPPDDVLINVHLTGIYNNQVFEDRDVEFCLGEGKKYGVIEGVEVALRLFTYGEKSRLRIHSKYAFKDVGKPEFNIPPNATVDYIVELKTFECSEDIWCLQPYKSIEQVKIAKLRGANYFKANKYNLAIDMYNRMIVFLNAADFKQDGFEDLKKEIDSFYLSAHLNLALCYLKTDQNVKAKNSSNEALKLSPQNVKALFRRGQAYLGLASPEIAIKDFQEVLKLEPKNTAAIKQKAICCDLIKKHLVKEKKQYANMFNKFVQEDEEKEEERLQDTNMMHMTMDKWDENESDEEFFVF